MCLRVLRARLFPKPWGREVWFADEPEYGGKILELRRGHRTSLHYHRRKKETLYVLEGRLRVRLRGGDGEETVYTMGPGEGLTLEPGCIHSLEALEDTLVIEASTQPLDDTVRVEDPYGRLRRA